MVNDIGKKQPEVCQFVDDTKGRTERYWFCIVHHAHVSDPLLPCLFSRYDGTPWNNGESPSGRADQG